MSSLQSRIRKKIRSQRRALTVQQQHSASLQIAKQLERHPIFLTSRRIAFFWPNDGEIDLTRALINALARHKHCYLPVLYRGGENRLLFGRFKVGSSFKLNRFGIPEPDVARDGWLFAQQLDLILTPLVAFDGQGNRIGMGGGFYDRSLRHLNLPVVWRRPYLLGVAHEFQHLDAIGRNSWDIPLRGVVTDQQAYYFDSSVCKAN